MDIFSGNQLPQFSRNSVPIKIKGLVTIKYNTKSVCKGNSS